ncbi:hypothetical protein JCM11641_004508 [Rhodosporidiobolus odoratus]
MSNNLSHSMRENYGTHGVSEYYKMVQESYRNPHFLGLKKVLAQFMDQYTVKERPKRIRVLDLAAGSGEATIALQDWYASRWPSASPVSHPPPAPTPSASSPSNTSPVPVPPTSIPTPRLPIQPRQPFLPTSLSRTRPPFLPPSSSSAQSSTRQPVSRPSPSSAPLSLSSQASAASRPELSITAADPFTSPAYLQRTGLPCLEMSFADVANGLLPPPPSSPAITSSSSPIPTPSAATDSNVVLAAVDEQGEGEEENVYDLVIISFALHLVESTSELWALLTELAKRAKWLVVVAPHKKPDIKPTWSFRRWTPQTWRPADDSLTASSNSNSMQKTKKMGHHAYDVGDGHEIVTERVRLRVWRSEVLWDGVVVVGEGGGEEGDRE